MRGPDKQPRKRRGVTVDEEFMPGQGETTPPEQESLKDFAASILADEGYRDSLRARSKTGKLSPAESRLLIELGQTAKPKDDDGRRMVDYLTENELTQFARICRLAIAREAGKPLEDDPARRWERKNLVGETLVSYLDQ